MLQITEIDGYLCISFQIHHHSEQFKPPNHQKLDPAKPAGLQVRYADTVLVG
jgi:hypothetical protein